jgi:hypothetical protein
MQVKIVTLPKQKSWGLIEYPGRPGEFYTGYDSYWPDHELNHTLGSPKKSMQMGKNVVITGDFKVNSMSRGRSAATFSGTFRGSDFEYDFGMQGMVELMQLIQSDKFGIVDGYISGVWTLAKQGTSIFLKPYVGE